MFKKLFQKKFYYVVIFLMVTGFSIKLNGAAPTVMNFQGKLLDNAGTPIDGTKNMIFRIYAVSTGGTAIWQETQNSVSISTGIFNVLLGSTNNPPLTASVFVSTVPSGSNRYLEIEIDGTTVGDRQRIASVGYAYEAEIASRAVGNFTVNGNINTTGLIATTSGFLAAGQVRASEIVIGSITTPSARLNIQQSLDTKDGGIFMYNTGGLGTVRLWIDDSSRARLDGGGGAHMPIILNGDGNGNVGISTNSPIGKLHISTNNARSTELLTLHNRAQWEGNFLNSIKWRDSVGVVGGIGARYDGSSTNFDFHSLYHSGAYWGDSSVAMTIKGTGDVLIGTNTADGRLTVKQDTDSSSGGITVWNSFVGGSTARLWMDNSSRVNLYGGSTGSRPILLNGSGSGKIGIGLSTDPSEKLHLNGHLRIDEGYVKLHNNADTYEWWIGNEWQSNDNYFNIYDAYVGRHVISISSSPSAAIESHVGISCDGYPGYVLTIKQNSDTDPRADSWQSYSCYKDQKNILSDFNTELQDEIIQELNKTNIYKYTHKELPFEVKDKDGNVTVEYRKRDGRTHIGIVVDECTNDILDKESGDVGIDLLDYCNFLMAVVKKQQMEIEDMKSRLSAIENK